MLYGSECWAMKESYVSKMRVAEMRTLRWMSNYTRLDKVRNESIRKKVGVALIENKCREGRQRWFIHVNRRHTYVPVRQVEHIGLEDRKKRRGIPKLTWKKVVQHDL